MVFALTNVAILHSPAEMLAAERLLQRVWGSPTPPLEAATMTALAHAGNYVAGAFAHDHHDEMLGCAVGFFGPPAEHTLHSHITGVLPGSAGRGIGMALKSHQRAWCLTQGVSTMTWTFDPAIARNAHFNLNKLGVTALAYLEDFYGPLDDDLNAGSPTDRLLVRWDLEGPAPATVRLAEPPTAALAMSADGAPMVQAVSPLASSVLVQVPSDIETLRRSDPTLAADWRFAIREVLGAYLGSADTWRITGFLAHGHYVLERTS